jgi:hypothetical protein
MNTTLPPSDAIWPRTPLNLMRWGPVFAGLAVGLSIHLLLMLLGAAAGFTAVDAGARGGATAISIAAGTWDTLSMLVSAFFGAYFAARTSGLGRASDGMLYGVVSWGATTLLLAVLATTVLGSAAGMFSRLIPSLDPAATSRAIDRVAPALRDALPGSARTPLAPQSSEERPGNEPALIGLPPPAVESGPHVSGPRVISAALRRVQSSPIAGGDAATARASEASKAEQAADIAGAALWWLFAATLGSLLLALAGGALGARATSRRLPSRSLG